MGIFKFQGKTYHVDCNGFLIDSREWDENFAVGMAPKVNIPRGLTEDHWKIIHFIRNTFKELGKCPLVYQTCSMNGIRLKGLRSLFPTGYLRGACKLAGITYKEGYLEDLWANVPAGEVTTVLPEKTYRVDVHGFLVDPEEWDEYFAKHKAYEMKMGGDLTDKHWKIIRFLRESYEKNKTVPTVYETCEANSIEIEELERLFPDGYHTGAVKLAGLRVRLSG